MAPAELRAESCGGRTTCTLPLSLVLFAAPSVLTRCQSPWSPSARGPDRGLWNPAPPDELFLISCCLSCHLEYCLGNAYICILLALIQGRILLPLFDMSGWNRKHRSIKKGQDQDRKWLRLTCILLWRTNNGLNTWIIICAVSSGERTSLYCAVTWRLTFSCFPGSRVEHFFIYVRPWLKKIKSRQQHEGG